MARSGERGTEVGDARGVERKEHGFGDQHGEQ
jgi:hypothetical protein